MGCCKKNENCGVIGRIFVYIFGFIGIAFSLLTVFSCEFISYSPNAGILVTTLPPPFLNSQNARVGLFRWQNLDIENSSCVYYTNDQINGFDSSFRAAQIFSYVAVLCAGVSLLLSTVEFVCCRFCCSKFFLAFFMSFALITQGLTFAIYEAENMWYVMALSSRMEKRFILGFLTFFFFPLAVHLDACVQCKLEQSFLFVLPDVTLSRPFSIVPHQSQYHGLNE